MIPKDSAVRPRNMLVYMELSIGLESNDTSSLVGRERVPAFAAVPLEGSASYDREQQPPTSTAELRSLLLIPAWAL